MVAERIETDRDGKIIMNPPAAGGHGDRQVQIGYQLTGLLPKGRCAGNGIGVAG